jgi:hypothetical protein
MKKILSVLHSRAAQITAAVSALFLGVMSNAHAELPTGATTAFSAVQTDALALIDLAWPAVIAVVTGFIILKLFKKAANKIG